jgi:hypothetical protein
MNLWDEKLYFRSANRDELGLALQFLKDAAFWLREKPIDYGRTGSTPPPSSSAGLRKDSKTKSSI